MSVVKLKICGVKSVAEAKSLLANGVDFIGLNFIPSSSRYISLETATSIMAELKTADVRTVALFAARPLEDVNDYASRLGVDYVQLHGDEPAGFAEKIEARVIRAVPARPDQTAVELVEFMKYYPADYFVLDRERQGQGSPVNSDLAAGVISALPGKIFLAGGLAPDNLSNVLAEVRPYGIDIAGGVRDANDDLDIAKVNQCLEIIRSGD